MNSVWSYHGTACERKRNPSRSKRDNFGAERGALYRPHLRLCAQADVQRHRSDIRHFKQMRRRIPGQSTGGGIPDAQRHSRGIPRYRSFGRLQELRQKNVEREVPLVLGRGRRAFPALPRGDGLHRREIRSGCRRMQFHLFH